MIRVLVTGGTFDKEYNELNGQLFFRNTHVPEMLRRGRCRVDVFVQRLMMIDSLEMTAHERAQIVEACRTADESQIVITHGTDTMVETAKVLAEAFPENGPKTIVLTGEMVPYAFGRLRRPLQSGQRHLLRAGIASWRVRRNEWTMVQMGLREEKPRNRRVRGVLRSPESLATPAVASPRRD